MECKDVDPRMKNSDVHVWLSEDQIDERFRGIISHALLGEREDISREGFELIISECVKYYSRSQDRLLKHIDDCNKKNLKAINELKSDLDDMTKQKDSWYDKWFELVNP